jgi:hypothetical protein
MASTKFIFLQRNPEEIAASGWWTNHNKKSLVAKIKFFYYMQDEFAEENPDSCLRLDYSELTQASSVELACRIGDFLHIKPNHEGVLAALKEKLTH